MGHGNTARDRRLSVHQVLQERVLGGTGLLERVLDRVSLVARVRREPGAVDHLDAAALDLEDQYPAVSVEDDEVGFPVALAIRANALPRDRVERQAVRRVELLQGRDDLELGLGQRRVRLYLYDLHICSLDSLSLDVWAPKRLRGDRFTPIDHPRNVI